MSSMFGKSVAAWNPGEGKPANDARVNQLMSTTAKDDPDCMTATNDLKEYEGGKGTPSAPFGLKGKDF